MVENAFRNGFEFEPLKNFRRGFGNKINRAGRTGSRQNCSLLLVVGVPALIKCASFLSCTGAV
jgi:hypothetical protein